VGSNFASNHSIFLIQRDFCYNYNINRYFIVYIFATIESTITCSIRIYAKIEKYLINININKENLVYKLLCKSKEICY